MEVLAKIHASLQPICGCPLIPLLSFPLSGTALDDPTRRRLAAMFEDALEKSREGGGGHGRRGAVEDSTSSTHAFLRSSFVRGEE